MVRLRNVIDIRTGRFHSDVIVNKRNVKWFIPTEEPVESE